MNLTWYRHVRKFSCFDWLLVRELHVLQLAFLNPIELWSELFAISINNKKSWTSEKATHAVSQWRRYHVASSRESLNGNTWPPQSVPTLQTYNQQRSCCLPWPWNQRVVRSVLTANTIFSIHSSNAISQGIRNGGWMGWRHLLESKRMRERETKTMATTRRMRNDQRLCWCGSNWTNLIFPCKLCSQMQTLPSKTVYQCILGQHAKLPKTSFLPLRLSILNKWLSKILCRPWNETNLFVLLDDSEFV